MALETMHRNLKVIYFQENVVKRLDEAIQHLLKYLKDRRHDWIISRTKGKTTKKHSCIFEKHQLAVDLQWSFVISPLKDNIFLVQNTITGTSYEVQIEDQCDFGDLCSLKCTECNCCLKRISCDCPDNSIKFEFCKHCHLVNLFLQNNFTNGSCIEIESFLSSSGEFEENVQDVTQSDELAENESDLSLSLVKLTRENLFLQHNYAKNCLMDETDFEPPELTYDEDQEEGTICEPDKSVQRVRATFENFVKDLELDSNEKTINRINDLLSKEHQCFLLKKSVHFEAPETVVKTYKHKRKQDHQKRNLYSIKRKNVQKARYFKLSSEKIKKIRQSLLKNL